MTPTQEQLPCGNRLDCTGCGACSAACPHDCLPMVPDSEGFLFPCVDASRCSACGACFRMCPIPGRHVPDLNTKSTPLDILASWNLKPEVRNQSSSGGVFSALAALVLEQNGVVIGAATDEQLTVRHIIIEDARDLHRIRGSKYVQSKVSKSIYGGIRSHLRKGRRVLFAGTPCQVAGVRKYIGTNDSNLLACDLICHGVPSPRVLRAYLEHRGGKKKRPTSIDFRNKNTGWKNSSIRLGFSDDTAEYSKLADDSYFQAFIRDLGLREACYRCAFASLCRAGDVTIGDYWGAQQDNIDFDQDDRGTSVVLVNTQTGRKAIEACRSQLFCAPAALDCVLKGNPMLEHPAARPPLRSSFYRDLAHMPFSKVIRKYRLTRPLWRRIGSLVKHTIIRTTKSLATWLPRSATARVKGDDAHLRRN